MAATFRTRPWLLASSARPALSRASDGSRNFLASMQQTRQVGHNKMRTSPAYRTSVKRQGKQQSLQAATSTSMTEMTRESDVMGTEESAILAPGTFVPLPLSKIQGWDKRLKYYRKIFSQRLLDRFGIFYQVWRLKESFFSRAKFRAERKGIVETALALHAEMSHYIAKGGPREKVLLADICVSKLHRKLVAAIDTRPRGKTYKWERVSTTGQPFWPRIVDHKWIDVDIGYAQSFVQAVVGIKSKQRLIELGADGQECQRKEMDLTEYVVLRRQVNKSDLTMEKWKIYGTMKETTYEDLMKQIDEVKAMSDSMAKSKIRETEKRLAKS